jgi:hypothetical protein
LDFSFGILIRTLGIWFEPCFTAGCDKGPNPVIAKAPIPTNHPHALPSSALMPVQVDLARIRLRGVTHFAARISFIPW